MKRFFNFSIIVALLIGATLSAAAQNTHNYPTSIESGPFKAGHIQGIAVDTERGYVYYSYTTQLIKTDLKGNIIGSVKGLLGHLGDMDFNKEDGRVYGSLEYKNDAIGKGIMRMEKSSKKLQNAFYIAIFDVDRITRPDMDAEKDGIMTTVYLPTVLEDYMAKVELNGKQVEHRLGCSGIDGVSFGPKFGKKGGKMYLTTTYGVYSDTKRTDNDYQVLLQYDIADWRKYERSLSQDNMHTFGPEKPDGQYFAYTGNTTYGVQNLEYDEELGVWWMAVYKGRKEHFPNYSLYAIDGSKKPRKEPLKGVPYIAKGNVVTLWQGELSHPASGTSGWEFGVGSTGLAELGGGLYYISHNYKIDAGQGSTIRLYRRATSADKSKPFVQVK